MESPHVSDGMYENMCEKGRQKKEGNVAGLTAMKCKNAKPGIHGDGNGLYLRVWPSGSRSWIQRLVIQGKRTDLGLGSFPVVSLAEAREKAFENRRIARNGGNPKQAKAVKVSITFREASEKGLEHNQEAWKGGADSTHATKADWAVKELCLGHAVGNKVERTYATSDLFERRRRLMEQWAAFATGERGKVVRMSA